MSVDTQQIILDELRAFRLQVQPLLQDLGERLASEETKMDSLYGGELPGLVQKIDLRLQAVEHTYWKWAGAYTLLLAAGSFLGIHFLHK